MILPRGAPDAEPLPTPAARLLPVEDPEAQSQKVAVWVHHVQAMLTSTDIHEALAHADAVRATLNEMIGALPGRLEHLREQQDRQQRGSPSHVMIDGGYHRRGL